MAAILGGFDGMLLGGTDHIPSNPPGTGRSLAFRGVAGREEPEQTRSQGVPAAKEQCGNGGSRLRSCVRARSAGLAQARELRGGAAEPEDRGGERPVDRIGGRGAPPPRLLPRQLARAAPRSRRGHPALTRGRSPVRVIPLGRRGQYAPSWKALP